MKVGLGAIVSGVTTYIVTRRTHSHELIKSAISDSAALLRDGALKLEKSSSSLNNAINEYDAVVNRAGSASELTEALTSILAAYNDGKDAKTLFYLIDAPKFAALLMPYLDAVEAIRVEIGRQLCQTTPNANAIGALVPEAIRARHAILDGLGQAYKAIWSRTP